MTSIGTKYVFANNFIFDPNNHSLLDQANDHTLIKLGSNESRILSILIEQSPEVVSRDELHQYVWRDQGFQVDDSSLTQAISTLRKILNDSTRAPRFIKTIPKRGYQFIAPYEQSTMASLQESFDQSEKTDHLKEQTPYLESPLTLPEEQHQEISPPQSYQAQAVKKHHLLAKDPISIGYKALWLIALIIPFIVMNLPNDITENFVKIASVEKVDVYASSQNPELTSWLPLVTRCITKFVQKHADEKPHYIIISGGQNENIGINFIYPEQKSMLNQSFQVYTDDPEKTPACS